MLRLLILMPSLKNYKVTIIVKIQDQEKDRIASLNKEVKSIFHRLSDDQIKLESVEDQIQEKDRIAF